MQIDSFMGRYEYLKLSGAVAEATFGGERWMNQQFYHSAQWAEIRQYVIVRDQGCDLAWPEFPLHTQVFVHHMNPMSRNQLANSDEVVLDPEVLITVSHRTHNAIHYGDESQLPRVLTVRRPGDTTLWRKE